MYNFIGKMLMVMPNDIIKFTKNGNEMVGIINLTNTSKKFITYKVIYSRKMLKILFYFALISFDLI